MGKLIARTVAICAGLVLSLPAMADVKVSGNFKQTVAIGDYVKGNESEDSMQMHSNSEIHFSGNGTTDGGLKVTARVELDADNQGDIIDEQWIAVEGNFGKITLGNNDAAAIEHGYVGIGGGFGDLGYYDGTDSYTPSSGGPYPGGYNDGQGIRYSSPSIGGFSAGVSYQSDVYGFEGTVPSDKPAKTVTLENRVNATSIGGSFSTTTGSFNLTLGGGYTAFEDLPEGEYSLDHSDTWGLGAELGFGGTTLFLRMDRFEDIDRIVALNKDGSIKTTTDADGTPKTVHNMLNQTNWAFGVEHQFGAATASIGYSISEVPDGGLIQPNYDAEEPLERAKLQHVDTGRSLIVAGAKYSLGGGVSVGAAIAWGEVEKEGVKYHDNNSTPTPDDPSDDDPYLALVDEDGTAFGAYIALSF